MVNSAGFGKRLQKVLDFYGLSAASFSEEITVNRSTISHLLSGRNKPSLDFILKVLEKFPEVELYWLLNGKGVFPSTPKNISNNKTEVSSSHLDSSEEKKVVSTIVSQENLSNPQSEIEKIIIFYEDGSFRSYQN